MWRILAPPLLGLPFGALPAVLVVFSARALAMISSLLECPQKNTRNTDTRKRLDENRSPPSARPAGAAGTGCGPSDDGFYRGKQIRLVVGTATGQDYDLWAR